MTDPAQAVEAALRALARATSRQQLNGPRLTKPSARKRRRIEVREARKANR